MKNGEEEKRLQRILLFFLLSLGLKSNKIYFCWDIELTSIVKREGFFKSR